MTVTVLVSPESVNAPSRHGGLPLPPHWNIPDSPPPISECGEPLVRLPDVIRNVPAYAQAGWKHAASDCLVRLEVAQRLVAAQEVLPAGFGLVVLDGWRSLALQNELYEQFYRSEQLTEPGYVSRPSGELRPPHTTGGAVDVTLSWEDQPLALGTDFDEFSPRAWANALESDEAAGPSRSLRRLLTTVLLEQGFANYPLEWWHFSYGDQWWAHFRGRGEALYNSVSIENSRSRQPTEFEPPSEFN